MIKNHKSIPAGTLIELGKLAIGQMFLCPWNGKSFKLVDITPSAAWVEVEEIRTINGRDKHGNPKPPIVQKFKKNEPWAAGTRVQAL